MLTNLVNTNIEDIRVKYRRSMTCPMCGAGLTANPVYQNFILNQSDHYFLYTVSECAACRKPFVSIYPDGVTNPNYTEFVNHIDYPRQITERMFDQAIRKISPDFVSLYHEAEIAEQNNLTRICGAGYRKALEFLVKDFLILREPENKTEIEKTSLGDLAAKFEFENLKTALKNATRLGNDQTHYRMIYLNNDLNDLKKSIDAVVYFIMMDEVSSHFIEKTIESSK